MPTASLQTLLQSMVSTTSGQDAFQVSISQNHVFTFTEIAKCHVEDQRVESRLVGLAVHCRVGIASGPEWLERDKAVSLVKANQIKERG